MVTVSADHVLWLNTRQRGDLADKNRFQPWNGTPMQGRLELSIGEKLLVLSRRTQRTDAPMGVFSCTYAGTDTPVPDLDAAHCGETLLGVPQSVYQRCAFIPSGSMAINADADLERRINALISTGEEKVSFLQAENRLKKQLHQRKYNRTGAIPQLEAEIGELMAARAEVKSLAEQETFLHSQLLQAQQEQKERLLIRQREIQRQAEEKQHLLQQLPDSATLQNINEQLGAVRSLAEQAQQAEDAAKQRDAAIQVQLQELNRNPLHPMTKSELETQLQIQPPAPPQVAQLLICLSLSLCSGGFLWYELDRPQILWLCIACAATALTAGSFLWLLVKRLRLQQQRRRELKRQEELRRLAESYLPLLEEVERQRSLLQQQRQAAADSGARVRSTLVQLLEQVRQWAPDAHSAADIRRFVQQTTQRREDLTQEIRQAQSGVLQVQPDDTDGTCARLQQQIAQIQGRLAAIGQPDDLERQLRSMQEQLAQLQGEYDALAMALGSLRTANVALQNRFSPELGRRAAEIFADMTGSDWSSILLDREFHLSAETGSDPTRRNVQLLSTGTADQLYLAVRLAICEMILPPEQNPPLILDDALLTFDDMRLGKTLDYLTRLGEKRQILLFTCQGREAAYLSGRAGVHIIHIR